METRSAKRIRIDRSAFQPQKPKRHRHGKLNPEAETGLVTCLDTPGLQRRCSSTTGKLREMHSADHVQTGKTYYFEEVDLHEDILAELKSLRVEVAALKGAHAALKGNVCALRARSGDKDLRFLFKAILTAISRRLNLSYPQLVNLCFQTGWVKNMASRNLSASFDNGITFSITRQLLKVIPQLFSEYNVLSAEYIHKNSALSIAFTLVDLNQSNASPPEKVRIATEVFAQCFSLTPAQVVEQASAGNVVEELESLMSDS